MSITIAIPFYNDERFLDLAIKSVFSQTYTDWKLILISDGGTDNSLSIARRYENDSRVTVVADGENRKLPYRLNQIAKLSTTKYLARMDADDIMHPERIEKQLEILENNPGIDVLGTNAFSIDDKNNIQGLRMKVGDEGYHLVNVRSFIHPSIMAKTEWFLNHPYNLDAIRMEDAELWKRTYKNNNFKAHTKPLLFYREFGSNYYKKYFDGAKSRFLLVKTLRNKEWIFEGLKMVLKGGVYFLGGKLNFENRLLIRRNSPIPDTLLNRGNEVLKILNK